MRVLDSDLRVCFDNTLTHYVGVAAHYKYVRNVLVTKAPMTLLTLQILVEKECGRSIDFEWLRRLCTLIAYKEKLDVPTEFILMDSLFANLVYWASRESVLAQSF